jgi:hypothetical protein
MLEQSLDIIRTVLKSDPTVTPPQRKEYLGLLVNGKATPPPPASDVPRILRPKVVAERMGRSTRSVHDLCRQGILKKVILPGRSRSSGILESSLLSAISG